MKEGVLPDYLTDQITYIHERHQHETRQRSDFYINVKHKTFSQNYIYFNGLKMFTALPIQIKSVKNVNEFKRKISEYVKKNI